MAWDANVIRMSDVEVRSDRTDVNRQFFNTRYKAFVEAILKVSNKITELDVLESDFVDLALQRLDTALGPMLELLTEAAELGFLVCQSTSTSASLTLGAQADFNVNIGRELFTPTRYLLVVDNNDINNWGIVEVLQWTKQSGDLSTTVRYASKTQTSVTWSISVNAAVMPAMTGMLEDAEAAASAATAAQASIADDMVTIQQLLDELEGMTGPVQTVNGQAGPNVVIGIADISTLQTTLNTKVDSAALTAGLATKQASSTKLTTLSNMTWQANQLLLTTSTTALGGLTFTPFAQGLFSTVDAAAARTTFVLGNVNNTSDANKPISTATQTALNAKYDTSAATAALALKYDTSAATAALALKYDTSAATAALALKLDISAAPGALGKATGVDLLVGTDDAKYVTSKSILDASAPVALTDGATISAPDMAAGVYFTVTIAGTGRTLPNPVNIKVGRSFYLKVKQDGTGNRTLPTYGNAYDFGQSTAPTLSTAANAEDLISFFATTASRIVYLGMRKGIG